jgi:hypothetical protein
MDLVVRMLGKIHLGLITHQSDFIYFWSDSNDGITPMTPIAANADGVVGR